MNTLLAGARLHWYEVGEVLGQGGFGVTYSAIDTNLGRRVAIKEYFPQGHANRTDEGDVHSLADLESSEVYHWGLSRFLDEARTLARLQHRSVVQVLSVFEANGTAYMVMEHEVGPSLEDAVRSHGLEGEEKVLQIAHELMNGLEHVHATGFIHRDIKPTNIIIRPDGSPVLLDFGSARFADVERTQHLTTIVSRGYAPFEQYDSGTDAKQGPWSDIYGLAATLFRVITGKAPSDALTRGTRLMEGASDPQSQTEPSPGAEYSPQLLDAIDNALKFRAIDRPQSIAEWREMFPLAAELVGSSTAVVGSRAGIDQDSRTEVSAVAGAAMTVPVGAPESLLLSPLSEAAPLVLPDDLDLSALKVMVVDDEPFVRNLTRRVINNLGIEQVSLAGDGHEALRMLDSGGERPDIILSDLMMPGMDGIEFLRHLGERKIKAGIVLASGEDERILQTAHTLASSHDLYILGAIQKPIKPVPLQALLAQFDPDRTVHSAIVRFDPISEEELREGIKGNELHVVYQPKVSVAERRVVGVEALARWKHPLRGVLEPGTFIPLAEEVGLIDELTDAVFSKAMALGGTWRAAGLDLDVSVNFSTDSLNRFDLPEWIVKHAESEGMDPHKVIVEVTESRMIQNVSISLEIVSRARLRGVGLSIDDFGTGHSSMEQIKRIPFTELKIDRAFVSGATTGSPERAIFESSVSLGKSLGLHLVAEGVETQADWDVAAKLGCDAIQGNFVSKPIEGETIPDFVSEWERG